MIDYVVVFFFLFLLIIVFFLLFWKTKQNKTNRKSSCGDLQSRLKVRKVLGVGDTTGTTSSSKISQILGHSDHLIFQLPPKLATWLLLSTTLFSCLTLMVCVESWNLHLTPIDSRVFFGRPGYVSFYPAASNRHFILAHPTRVSNNDLPFFPHASWIIHT